MLSGFLTKFEFLSIYIVYIDVFLYTFPHYFLLFVWNFWGEKRFESKDPDSSNTIVLSILKANTLAFPLNTEEKIEDLWNSPASLKLEMYIEVYIELLDDKGVEIAYCEVKAFRSKVLREDISLEERDFQIQEMTKSIFNDFDRLAVEKIKEVFRDYII